MAMTNRFGRSGQSPAHDLLAAIGGKIALPGDDAYAQARQIWNGAVDHRPALFVFCETTEEVQAAVAAARAQGLPLSVRGGGHDWAGRALRADGVVIDLSAMRRVVVDPLLRVATIGGGARAADVIAAAARHGLAPVTGNCGAVGMAGLTLGGGYGPLSPRYGLALDNLLGAEVVLADGQRVDANDCRNSDLFWALRGGGGNFGVVTSMRLRLHPVREVLAGMILFPWSEATSVLHRYAEAIASQPDELDVLVLAATGPGGGPVLMLAPTWSGEPAQGEPIMDGLQRFGPHIAAEISLMTCSDRLGIFDAHVVNGRHYAIQTRWLPALTSDVVASLVAAAGARPSPLSVIALHHLHGAATRVAPETTAFGLRREHVLVEILAAWEPGAGDDGAAHRDWARHLSQVLAPSALPGGYANLLGPAEHEQIDSAYGGNIARLRQAKRRFDPDGVFTSAISLPSEIQGSPVSAR